jgi:hypothetical protein
MHAELYGDRGRRNDLLRGINKLAKMPGTGQNSDWSLFLGNSFKILGNLLPITGAWRLFKVPGRVAEAGMGENKHYSSLDSQGVLVDNGHYPCKFASGKLPPCYPDLSSVDSSLSDQLHRDQR